MSRDEIEDASLALSDEPVSRGLEAPPLPEKAEQRDAAERPDQNQDSHIRSLSDVWGYKIQAVDEDFFGCVEDLVWDDRS